MIEMSMKERMDKVLSVFQTGVKLKTSQVHALAFQNDKNVPVAYSSTAISALAKRGLIERVSKNGRPLFIRAKETAKDEAA